MLVGFQCIGERLGHFGVIEVLLLVLTVLHDDGPAALVVAVHDVVAVKVVVVITKWVYQDLSHLNMKGSLSIKNLKNLEPAKVEDELKEEEEGNVDVKVGVVVPNLHCTGLKWF